MTDEPTANLGKLLEQFVNRISHRQGKTLSVLTDQSVTLQQVLLLRRVEQCGKSTTSEIAERMRMSLPAVSQMIDRLFVLGLLMRSESPMDRRRKDVSVTPKGHRLLQLISKARASEYAAGVASLPLSLRSELVTVLRKTLAALPEDYESVNPGAGSNPLPSAKVS
jgi:DNA-binding MarR family transcriptional regulator